MNPVPLRRELLVSFALLFAAALVVGVNAVLLILPVLVSPAQITIFVFALLVADLVVLFAFGSWLLGKRIVLPIERLTGSVARIAEGDFAVRASGAATREMLALEQGINAMADRLISDQERLSANIVSLDRTNSELVEARNQVVQSARLASVGTLAAGIAHEVGNPLGAILTYLDVLRSRSAVVGENLEVLDAIKTEARRIDRIVRSLLDYARPRTDEEGVVDPASVVTRVRDLLEAQGKLDGVTHEWHVGEDVPPVVMVPHRLEQVLVNLLLNAVDALEGVRDPRIVVSLHGEEGEVTRLPIRREGDPAGINYMHRRRISRDQGGVGVDPVFSADRVAVLTVSDNGPGVSEENLEKVFDPFFTTKEPGKGTGLGLAICARLVEGMGGKIDASVAPGGGAFFTIRLPAASSGGRSETYEPMEVLQ